MVQKVLQNLVLKIMSSLTFDKSSRQYHAAWSTLFDAHSTGAKHPDAGAMDDHLCPNSIYHQASEYEQQQKG